MASVQFYGIEEVMEAAENKKLSCWAIFINRALFSKYQDADFDASMDILQQNLDVLKRSGTTAIYCLKFFEEPGKINERTVCDGGSFNFKLIEPEQREGIYAMHGVHNRELEKKIKVLEDKLAGVGEEEETIHTVIRDIVKDPVQLQQYLNIGRALIGMPVQNFGAIGTVTRASTTANQSKEEKLNRLGNAIDDLEKSDPMLVENIEKLAHLAKTDPDKYAMAVSLLNNMK